MVLQRIGERVMEIGLHLLSPDLLVKIPAVILLLVLLPHPLLGLLLLVHLPGLRVVEPLLLLVLVTLVVEHVGVVVVVYVVHDPAVLQRVLVDEPALVVLLVQ